VRVLLIGPRGAGKTSAGRDLALLLGVAFTDADEAVEGATGESVAVLLGRGEFRAAERAVLGRLLDATAGVLATGGGAVLWDGLAAAAEGWRVVWLDADVEVLRRRIRNDEKARPSLTGKEAADEIGDLVAARASRYAALAEVRVDTSADDSETVAARIGELLRKPKKARPDSAD